MAASNVNDISEEVILCHRESKGDGPKLLHTHTPVLSRAEAMGVNIIVLNTDG